MPPKPKITRDMVIVAAFEVARKTGAVLAIQEEEK